MLQLLRDQSVENFLTGLALFLAIASLAFSWRTYRRTESRELRVEKSAAYLALEVQSSEVFQYAAEKAELMDCFRCDTPPAKMPEGKDYELGCETALNLYYQSLNLFEVCARFRRNDIIPAEVFASWVAWFHELVDDWYFRDRWRPELRANYTQDIREIFDVGCEIWDAALPVREKRRAFYDAVADIMLDCQSIRNWLQGLEEEPTKWRNLPSSGKYHSAGTSLPEQPLQPPSSLHA